MARICLLYTSNAYISIFTCPSVAKEGKISAIVPMVSHMDHTEHDVNSIITAVSYTHLIARRMVLFISAKEINVSITASPSSIKLIFLILSFTASIKSFW